jgi:hypothetical protein
VRLATAATYACFSGIRLLEVIDHLISFDGDLGGSGFWEFLVQEFPSTATPFDDRKPQAAMNGLDAAMSMLKQGIVLVPSYTISSDSNNIGSIASIDRIDDANSYMTFLSMALIGSLQNRYGLPTSNRHKSIDLPWTAATETQGEGCNFASALLHLYDGLHYLSTVSPPNIASTYASIADFLGPALDAGCSTGCTLCGLSCDTCPMTLRNRDSCTGLATDKNSCAAAGLTTFVNASWQGPP